MGILGGTFNPPHLGHLALARHARRQLGLERVLLVPARVSPHKTGAGDAGAEHRLRMCELLIDQLPGLQVCPLELQRDGPSYTVDTLEAIHASHPEAQLTLIVGADTATTLPSWRQPARLLALARTAVAARPGSAREQVLAALAQLAGDPRDVCFLDMPAVDVSSSLVRARAAGGEPIAALVGEPVAAYVAEHGLYGAPARAVRR